jgi:hypothetical protein
MYFFPCLPDVSVPVFSTSSARLRGLSPLLIPSSSRLEIESDQYLFRIGTITDDRADRLREFSQECRDGKDLVPCCQVGALQQIYYFYGVLTLRVFLAEFLKSCKSSERLWRLTGRVKAQIPGLAPEPLAM